MKCLDCPHSGGDRPTCCCDDIEARAAEVRRYRSGVEGAIDQAEYDRKRLIAEGQPKGNRRQRRAAMAKSRRK